MAKRVIIIAIIISGCATFTYLNESKAEDKVISEAGSGNPGNSIISSHKPPYKIINSRYVSRSTVKRSIDNINGVRIRIKQNGMDNTDIEDFSLTYDSGNEYRMGNIAGVENSSLPLYVEVTYRSWNTFHAVQFDVTYEFVIYCPGTWDVTIFN